MLLQKMKYKNTDTKKIITRVCMINQAQNGGEFTMCGSAIPDSNMNIDDFERDGSEYIGHYKDVTCEQCRKVVDYIIGCVKS